MPEEVEIGRIRVRRIGVRRMPNRHGVPLAPQAMRRLLVDRLQGNCPVSAPAKHSVPLHERDERDAERQPPPIASGAVWTTPQISNATLAANATKRKLAKRLNCAVHACASAPNASARPA